jgi:mRNA interferase RelE/StbE
VKPYAVYVTPSALREIRSLPGYVRQRVKRIIDSLMDDPCPPQSKALALAEVEEREIRRIRLDNWRILYIVTAAENAVDVFAVRKRPPYDYGDLERLLTEIN